MRHSDLVIFATFLAVTVAGCKAKPLTDREQMKAEIMVEVLTEVHQQLAAHGVSKGSVKETREQMKREIEQEVMRKLQMLAPGSEVAKAAKDSLKNRGVAGPVGIVEGKILHRGKGLVKCRVKLVRLVKTDTVAGLFKVLKEGMEFDAVTDKDGKYRLEGLPVGSYKLKWQLQGDKGWIRRLRQKPDVTVKVGEISVVRTVETSKGLVPS